MADLELTRIAAGPVTLHDAHRKARRTVELEPFEIGVHHLTEEQRSHADSDHVAQDPSLTASS